MRRLTSLVLVLGLTPLAVADAEGALRLARVRLDLAKDVALAKLYSRGAIEDLARERQVIEDVRGKARRMGVDPELAARFFGAQIEASKAAQRAWQAKWAREGAPFGPRPDLAKGVRPKLDRLTTEILEALKDARPTPFVDAHGPTEPWLKPAWRVATRPLIARIDRRGSRK
ncbi:MAG: gamma subclass chorismate mutase AroQ [Fimbriimonas sp.]